MSSPLPCGPPPPAAIYPDFSTAFAAIQVHAKDNGYAFIARDRKPTRVLYLCDRAGKYDNKGKKAGVNESNRRRQTSSKKTDCKMRATLSKDKTSDQWKFSVIDGEHNHAPSTDFAAHQAHRLAAISAETRSQMNTFAKSGLSSSQILNTLRTQGIETTLTSKDVSNVVQKMRTEELNGMSSTLFGRALETLGPFELLSSHDSWAPIRSPNPELMKRNSPIVGLSTNPRGQLHSLLLRNGRVSSIPSSFGLSWIS